MTSAKKSALTAVVMFVLISAVVLGGMTWATLSSFELAKKTVAEEQLTRALRALGHIDSMVLGFLNSEASRPAIDYGDFYALGPDNIEAVVTRDGRESNVAYVVFRTRLAVADSKPPYDWIDLYFVMNHKGKASSPQFDEEEERLFLTRPASLDLWKRRALESWGWFQAAVTGIDFRARVSAVLWGEELLSVGAEPEATQLVRLPQRAMKYAGRRTSLADAQRRHVPAEICVSEQIAAGHVRGEPLAIDSEFEETSTPPKTVRIKPGPFAPPFWIDPDRSPGLKLAFVRECLEDADVNYQGFIADWERLKPELLRSVEEQFPTAELVPVPNDVELDDDAESMRLHALPAVLRVPDDIPGGTAAAAWRSVRGVLLISWIASLAVLITAGWGVRNLVAITERRMQFAYAVTHELRTPLTTFRLYSDMLSAGLVAEESKQEYLDTLNRESQRLSSLVESVLEYARLENHKVKLHVAATDAVSLLRVVGETVEKRCVPNAVEGETRNSVLGTHPIHTDVSLVNQITAVLVDNACRHARGSSKPKVVVQLSGDNGRLFLDVMDSGPGVELRDSHTIFKPFRRGSDADATARGGIGLGLSLARNWAALLGGRLDLVARHHPQYGGAHFRLSIPSEAPIS